MACEDGLIRAACGFLGAMWLRCRLNRLPWMDSTRSKMESSVLDIMPLFDLDRRPLSRRRLPVCPFSFSCNDRHHIEEGLVGLGVSEPSWREHLQPPMLSQCVGTVTTQ